MKSVLLLYLCLGLTVDALPQYGRINEYLPPNPQPSDNNDTIVPFPTTSPRPLPSSTTSPSQPFPSTTSPPQPFSSSTTPPQPFSSSTTPPQPFSSSTSPPQPFSSSTTPPQPLSSSTTPFPPFSRSTTPPQPFSSSTTPFPPFPRTTTVTSSTTESHHHHHDHHHHGSSNPLDWLREAVRGEPGQDYPIYWKIPTTNFNCAEHGFGMYADEETQCQVMRYCIPGRSADSFTMKSILCPNGTIFDQKGFTCKWWHQVDCADSPNYFDLNRFLGVAGDPNDQQSQDVES